MYSAPCPSTAINAIGEISYKFPKSLVQESRRVIKWTSKRTTDMRLVTCMLKKSEGFPKPPKAKDIMLYLDKYGYNLNLINGILRGYFGLFLQSLFEGIRGR